MTAELIGRMEPGSPEWLAARRDGLGGSEVAAAIGLSPWCSPLTLWHRKRGDIGPGEEIPSMYWGKLLEPIVLAEYATRLGPDYVVAGHREVYRDGWRIASPDAQVFIAELGLSEQPVRLWEGKTADKDDAFEWGDDGSDEPTAIPPYYRVQCLHYMDVLGVHALTLSVLIGGNDYREYDVPWDADEAELIRTKAEAFWLTVVNGQRPAIDASSSTYETIRELHPDINGENADVPPGVADEYLASDRDMKAAKTRAQLAKTTLLDHMGDARFAVVGDQTVARRQPGRGGSVSLYPIHPKETP